MSAPHIPNLLTRGARPTPPGRGRGRGGLRGLRRPSPAERDKAVQDTDWDASLMRQSAVAAGYLRDPFLGAFATSAPERRLPVINRGTYVRTCAIDALLENWLKTDGVKQVVSLGAGTDTRYWRLREKQLANQLLYHEFDFPRIAEQKHAVVNGTSYLSPKGSEFFKLEKPGDEWGWSGRNPDGHDICGYVFHGVDLRQLDHDFQRLRRDVPTLILSECCLCYLDPDVADSVLRFFTRDIADVAIIIYEPLNPGDSFGQTMVSNLAHRGVVMPSLKATLRDQRDRLANVGMASLRVATINWIWDRWIPEDERARVSRLEMLDELEEWHLLGAHYSIAWGWTTDAFDCWEAFSPEDKGAVVSD